MTRNILLAVLLATTACNPAGTGNTDAAVSAGLAIGVDLEGLNKSVKPGDDFDEYANGGWRSSAQIPADRPSVGSFLDMFNKAEAANASIIESALKANAESGSDQRRIANWYTAFTDTSAIQARGFAPLEQEMNAIAAIGDKRTLSAMLGGNVRADVDPLNATDFQTENLLGLFVTQSFDNPDVNVPYVLQGGFGLPDRDYYLSKTPEMTSVRGKYQSYIARIFSLAKHSDPVARAKRVMELETKIAEAHTDNVTSQDANKANNPWTKEDFSSKAPGVDWNAFWAAAGLAEQKNYVVWHPATVTKLARLVAEEPLQTWQDWLAFHRINEVAAVLPTAFDQAKFDFYGKQLSGQQKQRPRDKRAIADVNVWLSDAVGKLYVQSYFPASSKSDIQMMVTNIKQAFDKRISALDWMSVPTKAEARKKIATMEVGIGYPDTWRDYSSLDVKADDPVGNLRRAELAETRHHLSKIGKVPDKSEWWMAPQVVNALNIPLQNALNFPAAILQAPFYDPKSDAAANYGAIGAVIGHEISHSFDDLGSTFDSGGRLRNWWSDTDLAHFKQQGAALIAQYNAYEALPGLFLNGKLTLSENIADVAGLAAAYDAYHHSLNGAEAPVIGGLTGDQRFFLAYAQAWREKGRTERLRSQIVGDVHAPARWRVMTVRNLDAWYAAFNVQETETLFLAPEKRVKIW